MTPSQTIRTITASILFAVSSACFSTPLQKLVETNLYSKLAHNCSVADLKTWRHPARLLLENQKIDLREVQLCDEGTYFIFVVNFRYDPQGNTSSFFLPLYDKMRKATQNQPYSFVDIADNTVVNISYKANGQTVVRFEMYQP